MSLNAMVITLLLVGVMSVGLARSDNSEDNKLTLEEEESSIPEDIKLKLEKEKLINFSDIQTLVKPEELKSMNLDDIELTPEDEKFFQEMIIQFAKEYKEKHGTELPDELPNEYFQGCGCGGDDDEELQQGSKEYFYKTYMQCKKSSDSDVAQCPKRQIYDYVNRNDV